MNIAKCFVGGNLTRDPEMRYTPKGAAVAEFGIAVNRKWKTEGGELREEVSFFNCAAFGRTAETLSQYCHKGDPLFIEGRLKQESWEDKQSGAKKSTVKIIIESFQFLPNGKRQEGESARPAAPPKQAPAAAEAPPEEEDDVPF